MFVSPEQCVQLGNIARTATLVTILLDVVHENKCAMRSPEGYLFLKMP